MSAPIPGDGDAPREDIPNKLYFRIGEVSKLAGVKPFVLRFWETEFPGIVPKKSGSGHRLYRRKDVELILTIKHLLYVRRFTIEGARQHLAAMPRPRAGAPARPTLDDIRRELQDLLQFLSTSR